MLKRKSVVMAAFLCVLFVPQLSNAQWVEKWRSGKSFEQSSFNEAGSAYGDFNGDGNLAILVFDRNRFKVISPLTGAVEFTVDADNIVAGGGSLEIAPVVLDLDNDGRAEIFAVFNDVYIAYEFVGGGVGVNDPEQSNIPKSSQLFQNYPNPFNPETTIEYSVIESGPVEILIFNQLGQRTRTLINELNVQPGKYSVTWDGKGDNGKLLASGNYYYQIRTRDFISTKKSILLK